MGIVQPFDPATTVDQAYAACHPETPLGPGDSRYVTLTEVRGEIDLPRIVARRIQRTPPATFHKQLVTGHRGCGKSTELHQLRERLKDQGFFPVYFDVEDLLDPIDIEYVDILLTIGRTVFEAASDAGIQVDQKLLKSIDAWLAETVLTVEQRKDVEATLKSEFGVQAKLPFFLRIACAVTGQIRAGGTRRIEVRKKLEREVRVLLQRINDLFDDIQVRLARQGSKGLVVIVDGLEKMPYRALGDGQTSHSSFFVQHAEQLKAPHCHIVYTVPVSLVFNANLGDAFVDTDLIPMIKVTESDGHTPCERGHKALMDVIEQRVNVDQVFEARQTVTGLVEMSGGSVRDLLRLVRFACDETDDVITQAHVDKARRKLIREYDHLVRDEDMDALAQVAQRRRVAGDEASARLLHLRLVLEYHNDERWADLHPAVRAGGKMQDRLNA